MYDIDTYNAILGGSILAIVIVSLIVLAIYVLYVIGLWKLFKKAGKNGWEAIIPFYNTYVLVEISGLNWWYFLIAISGTIVSTLKIDGLNTVCNLASLAVRFFIFYNIAKKMHQESPYGFAVAGALVAPILTMVLGFSDKYTFDTNVMVNPNGPIGEKEGNKSQTTEPEKFCLGCGCKLKKGAEFCENCGKKVE